MPRRLLSPQEGPSASQVNVSVKGRAMWGNKERHLVGEHSELQEGLRSAVRCPEPGRWSADGSQVARSWGRLDSCPPRAGSMLMGDLSALLGSPAGSPRAVLDCGKRRIFSTINIETLHVWKQVVLQT